MWDFFVLEFLRKGIALKFLWVSCVQHIVEKGGRCKVFLCGVFSFRAVRGKAVAVKFFVGFRRRM